MEIEQQQREEEEEMEFDLSQKIKFEVKEQNINKYKYMIIGYPGHGKLLIKQITLSNNIPEKNRVNSNKFNNNCLANIYYDSENVLVQINQKQDKVMEKQLIKSLKQMYNCEIEILLLSQLNQNIESLKYYKLASEKANDLLPSLPCIYQDYPEEIVDDEIIKSLSKLQFTSLFLIQHHTQILSQQDLLSFFNTLIQLFNLKYNYQNNYMSNIIQQESQIKNIHLLYI